MTLLPLIAQLETLRAYERVEFIAQMLTDWGVAFTVQTYPTGRNLLLSCVGIIISRPT